jgi:hypothetical protein
MMVQTEATPFLAQLLQLVVVKVTVEVVAVAEVATVLEQQIKVLMAVVQVVLETMVKAVAVVQELLVKQVTQRLEVLAVME